MSHPPLRIEGAAGRAVRLGREHRRVGRLDEWMVTLHAPHVVAPGVSKLRGTQMLMSMADLDSLPGGGYPRAMGATHVVTLSWLAAEFQIAWLDDGARPRPGLGVTRADIIVPSDSAGRMIGRTLAAVLANGDVPIGLREFALGFEVAARTAARAAAIVIPVIMGAAP